MGKLGESGCAKLRLNHDVPPWAKGKVSAQDIADTIDSYIVGRNAERNRDILKRRYIDGVTYEALAEEFDLSVRYTKYLIYKNEDAVFDNLPIRLT